MRISGEERRCITCIASHRSGSSHRPRQIDRPRWWRCGAGRRHAGMTGFPSGSPSGRPHGPPRKGSAPAGPFRRGRCRVRRRFARMRRRRWSRSTGAASVSSNGAWGGRRCRPRRALRRPPAYSQPIGDVERFIREITRRTDGKPAVPSGFASDAHCRASAETSTDRARVEGG